jgi:hypothetical protein
MEDGSEGSETMAELLDEEEGQDAIIVQDGIAYVAESVFDSQAMDEKWNPEMKTLADSVISRSR